MQVAGRTTTDEILCNRSPEDLRGICSPIVHLRTRMLTSLDLARHYPKPAKNDAKRCKSNKYEVPHVTSLELHNKNMTLFFHHSEQLPNRAATDPP